MPLSCALRVFFEYMGDYPVPAWQARSARPAVPHPRFALFNRVGWLEDRVLPHAHFSLLLSLVLSATLFSRVFLSTGTMPGLVRQRLGRERKHSLAMRAAIAVAVLTKRREWFVPVQRPATRHVFS